MEIRHTEAEDLPRLLEIYAYARTFMKEHGNPRQWGATNWPPEALLKEDIAARRSYVCVECGRVVGTFVFVSGVDIEPTYREITGGSWMDDSAYGVIHRLAGDGSVKGIGKTCIQWACEQCSHLRVDTHPDNIVLQTMLTKLGFTQCGIIHVIEDSDPRLAYEKL